MRGGVSRRGLVLAGAVLPLLGCATTPTRATARSAEAWPELEPLLAAQTAGSDVRHAIVDLRRLASIAVDALLST